ncbi:hypothetical protein [Rhodopirellula sp. MGV]|uniref:hypothetical protein n=1 Tax=Rhodopirellula sp. MGV TaxID=2023130 RepID=UPI000B96BF35|nr:hypothetical protein [Rhodopirellula sp. MGV]OYP36440.1 hypothetical protein CGZ80_09055 [Rhodopirellula sp. MGV]PNY36867.1 hypothetical protein C2E31_10965 [Rhodopirellula baltica]
MSFNPKYSPFNICEIFEKEHGEDWVIDGEWVVYPDGYYREVNPHGVSITGFSTKLEQLKAIAWYWNAKLKREKKRFHELKETILGGMATTENADKLKTMQQNVNEYYKSLQDAKHDVLLEESRESREEHEKDFAVLLPKYAKTHRLWNALRNEIENMSGDVPESKAKEFVDLEDRLCELRNYLEVAVYNFKNSCGIPTESMRPFEKDFSNRSFAPGPREQHNAVISEVSQLFI